MVWYNNDLKTLLTSDYTNNFVKAAHLHWGKADERDCHSKMADMKLSKNLFCRLNCFYNVF